VFGFWVFLMSDLIIFGILFASYASYLDPVGLAGGPGPQDLFDLKSVAIQIALLLVGGLAYAGVSLAMKYDRGAGKLVAWLIVCAALGAGFLFFEIKDFITQAGKGGIPQASGWLSSYWHWWGCTASTSCPAFSGSSPLSDRSSLAAWMMW
jgi:cytochrome o ubiquinol oxidase subunit III